MSLRLLTHSASETQALGKSLGTALRCDSATCAILLSGDYGTGKTVFASGIASGLGVCGPVRSPSYLIAKVYTDGARALVHADLYRSKSAADIEELGLLELAGANGVIVVEWPGETLPRLLAVPTLTIHFSALVEEDARALVCEWSTGFPGPALEALHATPA